MALYESRHYTIGPSRFQYSHRAIESKHSFASSKASLSSQPTKPSPFLQLPTEIRLQIYQWALSVPNDYVDRPLIVVNDCSNVSTRTRSRNKSTCPSWTGEDSTARKLLTVNHQIHDEAEDFLYSQRTLFFRHSFDLDRLDEFLDTLSSTARNRIRSVGFEVFFFVHAEPGVPKRTFKQYEKAGSLLRARLPRWNIVLFYLDPYFYYPPNSVSERDPAARGVANLAARFGALCKEVVFYPLPDEVRPSIGEAQLVVRSPDRCIPRSHSSSRSGSAALFPQKSAVVGIHEPIASLKL
ncbi:hypothetical protein PENDEC_c015G01748 [Penicillium decumbens]|uniref:2EXR domain-containing protein n=1 Tax=Penicillium decumbens TaxID=69771 RepID=A0A1V6P8X9_PENDC|nr:hypothetical protein PENDEC_c015G01748 [Penicillium decumbens]